MLYSPDSHTYNFGSINKVQTSIKVSPSGEYISCFDRDKAKFTDKQKYSIIISISKGCPLACKFCHLTLLEKENEQIPADLTVNNIINYVKQVIDRGEDLPSKYVKLCFMGEGEPLLEINKVASIAVSLVKELINQKLAKGLDGIDISTSMPSVSIKKVSATLTELNMEMRKYALNPNNYSNEQRSIVRLFYSLHHFNQEERDWLIPSTKSIKDALFSLQQLEGINIVVHYMFMNSVNDRAKKNEINGLIDFINSNTCFENWEFRILRHNYSRDVPGFKESSNFSNIIAYIRDKVNVRKFKVQYSAGEDVYAACGMFL